MPFNVNRNQTAFSYTDAVNIAKKYKGQLEELIKSGIIYAADNVSIEDHWIYVNEEPMDEANMNLIVAKKYFDFGSIYRPISPFTGETLNTSKTDTSIKVPEAQITTPTQAKVINGASQNSINLSGALKQNSTFLPTETPQVFDTIKQTEKEAPNYITYALIIAAFALIGYLIYKKFSV